MTYHYYPKDLGHLNAGTGVQVDLTKAANAFLVDSSNFSAYKSGRQFKCYGGSFRVSPIVLYPPKNGRWILVVNYGGAAGPSPRYKILTPA